MPVRLDDLQGSTDVFGSNGEKVGQVHGIATEQGTGVRFVEVRTGFGGIGGADLWIPEDAIAVAVMGEPVRLKVTHDVAREQYVTKPAVL
ncbi:MAG: PRC-barrel domain-containing protein [Chloroflexota bacterium]|nr:PRC-barrel domain-containing protein [Chloroflexota bacterium]